MTGLEIGLLVVGILFFAGSFFFSEKLSSSDIQTIERMSEKEVNVLLDKHLKRADNKIAATIDSRLNEALNTLDREIAKKTTDELFSISEHADSVITAMQPQLDQMRKAHDEVMFIYNMLNDKQEKVTALEKEAGQLESALRSMKQSVEDAIERLENEKNIKVNMTNTSVPESVNENYAEAADAARITIEKAGALIKAQEQELSMTPVMINEESRPLSAIESLSALESLEKEFNDEIERSRNDEPNINEKILSLHRQGYSDVDIAKDLGKGLGEIRLVLGLFEDEE